MIYWNGCAFCQNVIHAFVSVKILCIFVAFCIAELFWHAFGYENNVRISLRSLIQEDTITLKTIEYEH